MSETKFFIGLDVHTKVTQYAVRTWQGEVILDGKCSSFYLDVKSALQPFLFSCVVGMEASTSFYPLREGFIQDQITVKVANVLRIRQLIAKNDKVDARRLSDMLRLGSFPESFIPPKEVQKLRDLVSVRHSFLQELNSTQSRIWAALTKKGVKIRAAKMFSKQGLALVEEYAKSEACGVDLKFLVNHQKNLKATLEESTRELIGYAQSTFRKEWERLQEIEGIGHLIAAYVVAEVCPVSRFDNEKKLRRYAGVVPCTKESAGKFHGSSIPKSSSRALLRWALVQAAHGAIRTKSSKLRTYYVARKKLKKNKAVMAVARQLSDTVFQKLAEV